MGWDRGQLHALAGGAPCRAPWLCELATCDTDGGAALSSGTKERTPRTPRNPNATVLLKSDSNRQADRQTIVLASVAEDPRGAKRRGDLDLPAACYPRLLDGGNCVDSAGGRSLAAYPPHADLLVRPHNRVSVRPGLSTRWTRT